MVAHTAGVGADVPVLGFPTMTVKVELGPPPRITNTAGPDGPREPPVTPPVDARLMVLPPYAQYDGSYVPDARLLGVKPGVPGVVPEVEWDRDMLDNTSRDLPASVGTAS